MLSYAFGAFHFTGVNIDNFFRAYCKHFEIQDCSNAEEAFNKDFNGSRWTSYGNGQKLIRYLHNNSFQDEFVKARKNFKVKYIKSTKDQYNCISQKLKSNSLLSLTLNLKFKDSSGNFKKSNSTHTMLSGWDNIKKNFFIIETTKGLYFEDAKSIYNYDSNLFSSKKHPEFDSLEPILDGTYSSNFNNVRFVGGDGLLLIGQTE